MRKTAVAARHLPPDLRPIFWDTDFRKLRWPKHRDFVIARVLQSGTWEHLQWLRREIGNDALRAWIDRRKGRGLSPPQLRFFELILKIPRRKVNVWLRGEARQVWDKRARA